MPQLPLPAMHWLAAHHGVVDRRQLEGFGVSGDQIGRRRRSGRLVAVHRGVFRSAEWPETEAGRCVAACLAVRRGAVSHQTAGRRWGLRRCDDELIHVLIDERARSRCQDVVLHRTTVMRASEVVRRSDGIRLTSPVRTACDLASTLDDPDDLASVIEQVIDEYRVRYVTVLRQADRLIRPGWKGAAALRDVLAGRPLEGRAQQSDLEVRFARALVRRGMPRPVRQFPLEVAPGITFRGDLAYPELRLVIELDHRAWHSGSQAALDKRRDRLVKLAGYDTVRVSDDDVRHRFEETLDQIVRICHQADRRVA